MVEGGVGEVVDGGVGAGVGEVAWTVFFLQQMCLMFLQLMYLQNFGMFALLVCFLWLLEVEDIGGVGGVAVFVYVAVLVYVAVAVAVAVAVVIGGSIREARSKNFAYADLVILYLMSRSVTVTLRYTGWGAGVSACDTAL